MKISGKQLADTIYKEINKKISFLKEKNIVPKLVIVQSSNLAAVNNYIAQKVKKGIKVGIDVDVLELKNKELDNKLFLRKKIIKISASKDIHGIIFQKPSHENIDDELETLINLSKDVDGFLETSYHQPPVYRGVLKVLENIFALKGKKLIGLLKEKNITLIGKGKTGGRTILLGLKKDGYDINTLDIIDSKTTEEQKKKIIATSDIIISAVGKKNAVDYNLFPRKSILIDIGVHFDEKGKIKGDYDELDIKDKVAYYTTTPGGIGSLTVAYLMDNVINSALIV